MKIAYTVCLSLALVACSGEEFPDLRDFVANSGAGMRGKVAPPPEIKPYEPFAYDNATALPDPFKPRKSALKSGIVGLNQPDFSRPKEELEDFPIDTMKMVGYLFRNNSAYAIVRAADGKLRRVKVGNYIGQNFGKITLITETEIKIKEMVQDSGGDWAQRESSLQLIE
jgi:type IV pilus assembly protein PilP